MYLCNNFANMRVLIVNTSERIGGAAIAANRLMDALKKNGVRASMLVRDKQTDRLTVHSVSGGWRQPMKFLWERLCIFIANGFNRKQLFLTDIANTGSDVTMLPEFQRADVIHLHWVNQGFLSLDVIEKIVHSGKKVVVTMHDQWYFTGVCHYSGECEKYMDLCHDCELMGGRLLGDMARKVFLQKQRIYKDTHITFVGCSRWMADMARRSHLAAGQRVVNIPNAINIEVFRPMDKMQAREVMQLPADKRLLLFGCQRITDKRKGFHLLVDALQTVKQTRPELAKEVEIVVVGGEAESVRNQVPFDIMPISYVSDTEKMVALYNAVDVYVTPSLQDNLPNTIMEAMACGVPCVGYNVGGISEMIDHKANGYVAEHCNGNDLADGIVWTLTADHGALSRNARQKVMDTYSENIVARQYMKVYED